MGPDLALFTALRAMQDGMGKKTLSLLVLITQGLLWFIHCSNHMTTLAGGFLVTNYNDTGHKVSKSNLDRGRKQKRPLSQTAVDAWHG